MVEKNSYTLSRAWFDWAFENQEKISPAHGAMFFWFIELNNRMGWAENFASPASQTMAAIGVSSFNTYKKIFNDLVDFGFVKVVKESKNQFTACIIALSNFDEALDKALDKAMTKHLIKQSESTCKSNDSINKQLNNKTIKQTNGDLGFSDTSIEAKKKERIQSVASPAVYPFFTPKFAALWKDFIEMRKAKKKPLTEKAIEINLNKIQKLSNGNEELAYKICEQTIGNSWSGFFDLPEPKKTAYQPPQELSRAELAVRRRNNEQQ